MKEDMAIKNLEYKDFTPVTSQHGIVMIDCWAEYCAACKDFNPVYEEVAQKFPDYTFAKIDAVAEKQLITDLEIEHIPTLMLYRDGILLYQQAGYNSEDKLVDIIQQAENIDMDEVKAHIAAKKDELHSSNN